MANQCNEILGLLCIVSISLCSWMSYKFKLFLFFSFHEQCKYDEIYMLLLLMLQLSNFSYSCTITYNKTVTERSTQLGINNVGQEVMVRHIQSSSRRSCSSYSFLSQFQRTLSCMCCVQRCREFYLSVPLVNLDAKTKQKRAELMSFWDRYMFHHGDKKMQHFNIEQRFST